jgi:hypothetical protein
VEHGGGSGGLDVLVVVHVVVGGLDGGAGDGRRGGVDKLLAATRRGGRVRRCRAAAYADPFAFGPRDASMV